MTTRHAPTLVLGGTGKTGRRIVARLTERDIPVRIGSRSGGIPFDWQDPATWRPVLADVPAVYVSYYPDLAIPGAAETVGAFARLARQAGVRRLVLLSGRGEPGAQHAERRVGEEFPAATVVRCSWFNQNFNEDYLLEPVLAGEVALPAAEIPEPFVDAEDIADVATAALTSDGHAGEFYELTGPRLLTFADAVAEIAKAAGRDIAYVPVTIDEYAAALAGYAVPEDVVWLLTHLFTEVHDGRNARLADGVQRALGRPPADFTDYAQRMATTGVWNPTDRPNPGGPR